MAGVARPVRIAANSSLACSTALSIFSSASKRVSSITGSSRLLAVSVVRDGWAPSVGCGSGGDQGADLFAADRTDDGVVALSAEDEHRQVVFLAETERGLVGDPQATL